MPAPLRVLLAVALLAPAARAEELVDGIAAQVGSDIVLVSEVLQMAAPLEAELRARGASEIAFAQVRAEALERMIEWRLIEKVVQDTELYAGEEEVDAAIAAIAEQNGITLEQVRRSVGSHGLTYDDYRKQIKRELERRKVVGAMLGAKMNVEEDDVRALYAERYTEQPEGGLMVRLRQVLVPFGEDTGLDRDAACAAVEAARQRVLAGERFEEVAREVSQVAPEYGGDIGWVHSDKAAPWMMEVVAGLEPGQTSELLTLASACCVLHLVERRDYQPVSYEQARPALEREVQDRQMAVALDEWLGTLRQHTYIERKGFFAEAASLGTQGLESEESGSLESGESGDLGLEEGGSLGLP